MKHGRLIRAAVAIAAITMAMQIQAGETEAKFDPAKTSRVREDTEWSITYSYGVHNSDLPRVLLIGDSICNGYQGMLANGLKGKVNLTYWATSKCVTDRDYLRELDLILDANEYAFISFNNGLHSLEGTNLNEWNAAYQQAVERIQAKCPKAKLYLTNCTPVRDEEENKIVRDINARTQKIAETMKLPVIDLYSASNKVDHEKLWKKDGVHFTWTGIGAQAGQINRIVREVLRIQ